MAQVDLGSMCSAFLFDMDGTIVDTEHHTVTALQKLLQERYNMTLSQEDEAYTVGRSWIDIYARLQTIIPQIMPLKELMELYVGEREAIITETPLKAMPGAVDFIRRVVSKVPCAIVTGSVKPEVEQVSRHLGISELFSAERTIASEDITAGKPDPQGYLLATKHLRVEPQSCVVFEDSKTGIAAGKAAGCVVIALRAFNYLNQDQSRADLIVNTFEDITDAVLAELLSKRALTTVAAQAI
jgi:sugar-phosphatase